MPAGRINQAFFVFLAFPLLIVSCAFKSDDKAFTSKLDAVDSLIAQGQTQDALQALKAVEKKAFSSYDCIGIFRRYMQLGESLFAENCLVRGLKRNPDNKELTAVYAHFLMRQNRIPDAARIAGKLAGTNYASILSEILLRQDLFDRTEKIDFTKKAYIPIYLAAYKSTGNPVWLRNCAVIDMLAGLYEEAASLHPDTLRSPSDAYFWALVMYDSGNADQAATDLDKADHMIAFMPVSRVKPETRLHIAALRSDLYILSGDQVSAETERRKLFPFFDASVLSALTMANADLFHKDQSLPALYTDSAYWAGMGNNVAEQYRLLTYLVRQWPDYAPGLIAYGRFAYKSSLPFKEDAYAEEIKHAGLKTIAMQNYDDLPKIPVRDALFRMDESLKRKKNPQLLVARLVLSRMADKISDVRTRQADLWQTLENNTTGTDMYPPLLAWYAVHFLISYDQENDAFTLFVKYIRNRYHLVSSGIFWDQAVSILNQMDAWECEYAAWFAASQHRLTAARRLYEYSVYETGSRKSEKISSLISYKSVANLAMIYSSTGYSKKALSLYGQLAGLLSDTVLKAEVLYRIACIQLSDGDRKAALQSLGYCITLDPSHEKARLKVHELDN